MRFHLRVLAAACCVTIGLSGVGRATPLTDVVFGNLGPSGTNALDSTNTDIGPTAATTLALAQGFTTGTGSPLLTIQSISIGAYASAPGGPRTVSIYSNVGNAPGSPLFTSSATTVTGQATYAFNFSGANLLAGTSYWVVPEFSTDWSWYLNADQTQPNQLNASGYSYLGTVRQQQASPGTWSNSFQPYSVSIVATTGVPEIDPSGLGSVVALLGGALGLLERRRLLKSA